jgi:hypothetical protein
MKMNERKERGRKINREIEKLWKSVEVRQEMKIGI